MTVIKDIRIYRSTTDNIDGNPIPDAFENRELHCIIHRIVMNDAMAKDIRENEKSMHSVLHKFDDIESPNGELIWPYKELEIGREICINKFN